MRIKNKLKRLEGKLPGPAHTIQLQWVDPDTGKPWYRLTLTPDGKGGHSVKEEKITPPDT